VSTQKPIVSDGDRSHAVLCGHCAVIVMCQIKTLTVRLQLSLYLIMVRDSNRCIDPRILKFGTSFKVRV
jgi:hypothetical protein